MNTDTMIPRVVLDYLAVILVLLAPSVIFAEDVDDPGYYSKYHVSLHNDTAFKTRYAPSELPEDPSKIRFLTDVGNWVVIDKADIRDTGPACEIEGCCGFTFHPLEPRGLGPTEFVDVLPAGEGLWSPGGGQDLDSDRVDVLVRRQR